MRNSSNFHFCKLSIDKANSRLKVSKTKRNVRDECMMTINELLLFDKWIITWKRAGPGIVVQRRMSETQVKYA